MSTSRRFVKVPAAKDSQPVKLVVTNLVFEMLSTSKITAVMTSKEFEKRPDQVRVERPGGAEALLCNVLLMHRCFHGYVPEGYPASEASRGRSTVFELAIEKRIEE